MAYVKNFSLDPHADRDIIRWLDEQTNQSAAIRAAIREYMAKEQGVTLADVYQVVRAIDRKLVRGTVAAVEEPEEEEGEEPSAAAAHLDGLLDRLDAGDLG